ncbi:MAG: PEPxxWA-CTERM sorting domain-containing protein [Caulobacteraceae bacterium]
MKTLFAAGAFAAVAAMATQSQAATYLLNETNVAAFGSGTFGTVEVTQDGANKLKYVITLADGYSFTDTGSHYAFSFALQGAPALSFTPPESTGFTLTSNPNGISNSPFSGFDYAVGCPSVCAPNNSGYSGGTTPSSMTFEVSPVTGGLTTSMVDFATGLYDGNHVRFAADIIKTKNCYNNCTGVVGGYEQQAAGAVPEPASWAMMILGVFGAGAALRLRRKNAVRPVSA